MLKPDYDVFEILPVWGIVLYTPLMSNGMFSEQREMQALCQQECGHSDRWIGSTRIMWLCKKGIMTLRENTLRAGVSLAKFIIFHI